MTITGPTDAIFKAFAMIAYKFEEVKLSVGFTIRSVMHIIIDQRSVYTKSDLQ